MNKLGWDGEKRIGDGGHVRPVVRDSLRKKGGSIERRTEPRTRLGPNSLSVVHVARELTGELPADILAIVVVDRQDVDALVAAESLDATRVVLQEAAVA